MRNLALIAFYPNFLDFIAKAFTNKKFFFNLRFPRNISCFLTKSSSDGLEDGINLQKPSIPPKQYTLFIHKIHDSSYFLLATA